MKYKLIFVSCILVLFTLIPISAMDSVNENTGTAEVWDSGYRGEGMVIAVLDLEFDVNHELFTLNNDTVPKLTKEDITAKIKTGMNCSDRLRILNKSPYVNAKIPFAYDYAEGDTNVGGFGLVHGTHIAGIIGANQLNASDYNKSFEGIAPEAQLLLMKISDSDGVINYSAAIEAMSDAISLGADVISLSWGMAAGFGSEIEELDFYNLIRRALNQGIDVIASAGNTPRTGNMSVYDKLYGISDPLVTDPDYGLVTAPSLLDGAVSVASYNNKYIKAKGHIETYSGKKIIYSEAYQAFADILAKPTEILNYVVIESDGNERIYKDESIIYKGKIVVMEYINDNSMMNYLKAKGAVGVIFYSQYENDPFMRTVKSAYIPVVYIGYEDGMALVESEWYQLTLFEYPSTVEVENPAGEMISYYSAWGTTSSLNIKPDIMAFGGNIYSTSPNDQYETMSGTSMATPVTAGSFALIKQYLKETGIETNQYTTRQLLMSTAEPMINSKSGIEYSPRRQGAGLVKLNSALKSDIVLYNFNTVSTKIELGDKLGNEFTMEFQVRNITDAVVEYDLNASVFTDAYYYDKTTKKYFTADYSIAIKRALIFIENGTVNINMNAKNGGNSEKLTISPNSTVTIKLNVIMDKVECRALADIFTNGFFIEGYIYLTPAHESGVTASIPYMGFYGDWNDAPIFDDRFYIQSLGSSFTADYGTVNFELGSNIFIKDTVNRNLFAFSPDDDGNGDSLLFLSKSLRNYYMQGFYITDSQGDIIFEDIKSDFRTKAYVTGDEIYAIFDDIWDGRDQNNAKYIYPDGQYYLSVIASIDEKSEPQVYTIGFRIDTEKPVISDEKIIEYDGDYTYEFTVEDNLAVQMVRIFYSLEDKTTLIGDMITYGSSVSKKSDIISVDITTLIAEHGKKTSFYVEIIDYAMNTVTHKVSLEDYKL